MNLDNVIKFDILEQDLIDVVTKSLDVDFVDNLRDRSAFVKLDSKIRGYLGEIGMSRFLSSEGITIIGTDEYDSEDNEDKDILINNGYRNLSVEIKTSLIPDRWKTLEEVAKNADIKIIKRESDYHDIKADFHTQIYFNQWRARRDNYLKHLSGVPKDYSVEQIIELMKLKTLRQVFIAWISKQDLIAFLDKERVKMWHYAQRWFWRCPLEFSNDPNMFIAALKNYK